MNLGTVFGVLTLVFVVFIHELGHFLAAKAVGHKVTEFSIGFGIPKVPPIRLFKWDETQFVLNYLPLGGYVNLGEITDIPHAKRAFIVFCGPAANILLAGIAIGLYHWQIHNDWLMLPVDIFNGVTSSIHASAIYVPVALGVVSNGAKVGGPLTVIQLIGQAAEHGLYPWLYMLSMVNVSLGSFQLLPLKVLDGGHLLDILFEKLRDPSHLRFARAFQHVSFVLLITLVVLAYSSDIGVILGH